MAVPLKELGLEKLDGKTGLFQVIRGIGQGPELNSYWAPTARRDDWANFGQVLFDPKASFVCLNSMPGQILQPGGWLIAARGSSVERASRKASARFVHQPQPGQAIDGQGIPQEISGGEKLVATQTRSGVCRKDGSQRNELLHAGGLRDGLRRQQAGPVPPDFSGQKLRHGKPAFALWHKRHIVFIDPVATYEYAFFPYYNKVRLTVDTKVILESIASDKQDLAKAIVDAETLKAVVVDESGRGNPRWPGRDRQVRRGTGAGLRQAGPCRQVRAEGLGHQGRQDGPSEGPALCPRDFPWEHNTIGLDRVVIPPYTPVKATPQGLEVWGRSYRWPPPVCFRPSPRRANRCWTAR